MIGPAFDEQWHGGDWVPTGEGGIMKFVPYGTHRDIMPEVEKKVQPWTLHDKMFSDGKEAVLQGGRLLVFYSGVRVVKQNDKYFILYWHKGDNI